MQENVLTFRHVLRRWPALLPIFGITHLPLAIAGLALWWIPLVLLPLPLAGYAAATYAVLQPAAGLSDSLAYGFRRCLGLTFWIVVTQLSVAAIGLLAVGCALGLFDAALVAGPVIGLAVATTALVGPVYIVERGNPIIRSLHLFLGDWWWMLRRLLVIGLGYGLGSGLMALGILAGGAGLLAIALQVPLSMVLFAAILEIYARRRGWI